MSGQFFGCQKIRIYPRKKILYGLDQYVLQGSTRHHVRSGKLSGVFLPRRRTVKNRKKIPPKKFSTHSFIFFFQFFLFTYLLKCLKIQVRIQSGPAGPVRSGNSYAQSGRALMYCLPTAKRKTTQTPLLNVLLTSRRNPKQNKNIPNSLQPMVSVLNISCLKYLTMIVHLGKETPK